MKTRLQITLKEVVRIILGCGLERKVNEVYMMGRATVVEYLRKLSIPLLSKMNYLRKPVIINIKLLPVWDKHQSNIRISHKNHYVLN